VGGENRYDSRLKKKNGEEVIKRGGRGLDIERKPIKGERTYKNSGHRMGPCGQGRGGHS